jgi:hypothetical protein
MAHAQKPDSVFQRNRRVRLNRQGHQFTQLLAAEVRLSALTVGSNAGYSMFRGSEKGLPTPFASFPFTSPPVHHRVPSHFNWSVPWKPGDQARRGTSIYVVTGEASRRRQARHTRLHSYHGNLKNVCECVCVCVCILLFCSGVCS